MTLPTLLDLRRACLCLLLALLLGALVPGNVSAQAPSWPDAPEIASYDIDVTLDAEARTLATAARPGAPTRQAGSR